MLGIDNILSKSSRKAIYDKERDSITNNHKNNKENFIKVCKNEEYIVKNNKLQYSMTFSLDGKNITIESKNNSK